MDPVAHIKDQPGYAEYKEQLARTPLAKFPWGTLAANIGLIAAAHGAGYFGAGLLGKALSKTPLGPKYTAMDPKMRKLVSMQAVGAAGSIGAVATGLASLAGQLRVAEEVARVERERADAERAGHAKVASALATYARVLRAGG